MTSSYISRTLPRLCVRVFSVPRSPQSWSSVRLCSSSRDGGSSSSFKSQLPPSSIHSPFADPTRNRTVAERAVSSTSLLSSSKKDPSLEDAKPTHSVQSPPPTPQKEAFVKFVEPEKEATPGVDSAIKEQYELAKSIPKGNAIRRVLDRWGLSIDPNATELEQRRQRTTRNTKIGGFFVCGMSLVGLVSFCLYYGRAKRDEEGKIVKDEYTGQILAPLYRIIDSFKSWRDYVVEPSRDKLLPDPLPPGYIQPKYTIVIEMKNVLVSPEWTYKTGYRFKLRPALDYFLDVIGYPNFEVVIYTSESSMTADPIIHSFDPKQRIMYRLYRDCTKYMNGAHVKDLSRLNRDLSKVIHIDWDPAAFSLHPENVLRVPKWDGDMHDTSLVDLAELLKTIHLSDVEDVRPVLEYYSSFDDPAREFRKRALFLAEQEAKQKQELEQSDQGLLKRYSGRLFGFRRHASV